jgi:hypothetical protein
VIELTPIAAASIELHGARLRALFTGEVSPDQIDNAHGSKT